MSYLEQEEKSLVLPATCRKKISCQRRNMKDDTAGNEFFFPPFNELGIGFYEGEGGDGMWCGVVWCGVFLRQGVEIGDWNCQDRGWRKRAEEDRMGWNKIGSKEIGIKGRLQYKG